MKGSSYFHKINVIFCSILTVALAEFIVSKKSYAKYYSLELKSTEILSDFELAFTKYVMGFTGTLR